MEGRETVGSLRVDVGSLVEEVVANRHLLDEACLVQDRDETTGSARTTMIARPLRIARLRSLGRA